MLRTYYVGFLRNTDVGLKKEKFIHFLHFPYPEAQGVGMEVTGKYFSL